jgi:exopolyphosphatase/guanosine-5'-triphosphate,3'-diphosphate pyrophosphatase
MRAASAIRGIARCTPGCYGRREQSPTAKRVRHNTLAAVDLGSNSFHLQVGRVEDGQIYLLDGLREPVRLGAGLTRDRKIDRATQLRALEALARFGERLRGFDPDSVRAVGTNTLRVAKNAPQFLAEARDVLGFPIEVIFGREEARLIYLGVSHTLPASEHRRLVVDIGGGSTEVIIGTGYEPELMESLPMGCVSYSLKYFADARVDKSSMKKAELAASNEVEGIVKAYRRAGWRGAVGSSGTAKSIGSVLVANGWSARGVSAQGLEKLRERLIKAGNIERLSLPGLREDRKPILAGGVAILGAIFSVLEIEEMEVSEGALRQGVLHDLMGRVQHHDMRELTVRSFMRRYHVDAAQAERVAEVARTLYAKLVPRAREVDEYMLAWAAALHEIGLTIAHAAYHKHSAYILSNADMPGFSRDEQARLARLVLAHRGKLAKLEALPVKSADWLMLFCLRLAALFSRHRGDLKMPPIDCRATGSGFEVELPATWLDEHPLTVAALEAEAEEWKSFGLKLAIEPVVPARSKAAG